MSSRRQLFNLSLSKDAVECNVALIGELGVGKSALTVKYLTKRFIMEYDPHIEDVYQKSETIEGQDVTVKIMDTCDTIEKSPERYFKWAHGIIVVYSITNRNTFDAARKFIEDVNQYEKDANKDISVVLLGNKVDLERYRTVSKTEGQELAAEYDCIFHEISAAEDFQSVEQLFQDIVRDVMRSMSLLPLFISEESKGSLFNPITQGRTFRRTKSPGNSNEIKDSQNSRGQDKDNRFVQRRMPSTFKIFKSRFNIFN